MTRPQTLLIHGKRIGTGDQSVASRPKTGPLSSNGVCIDLIASATSPLRNRRNSENYFKFLVRSENGC